MPDSAPLSTKDLFLLMVGLYRLKEHQPRTAQASKYYLDEHQKLRETDWNTLWFISPQMAWDNVRHRDWLLGAIVANLTAGSQVFSAISEPVFLSLDLLPTEIKPGMPNASAAIKQAVVSKSGYERSFLTTLSVGLSEQQSGEQRVIVLGAGMRRRTRVWTGGDESQALQADVEFYVPFYVIPGADPPRDASLPNARSICAGLAITRANGGSIGTDSAGKDLAAIRFNFRVPFTARTANQTEALDLLKPRDALNPTVKLPPSLLRWEPSDLVTTFAAPTVEAQKREMTRFCKEPAPWEKFGDWKKFVKDFCGSKDGGALLNAPIGPLLLETMSDSSSVKDILKSRRGEIEKDIEETEKELEEAAKLLKSLWQEGKPPDTNKKPDKTPPDSSQRQLGGLLESLGLLDGKRELKDLSKLTVWDVVDRMYDELDGFPLYVKGVDPKDDNGARMAFTLAAQTAAGDALKHYFGLAGLAYNIPVKTAASKEAAKEGDANAPAIVLGEEHFTDGWVLVPEDDEDDDGLVLIDDEVTLDAPLEETDGEKESEGKKEKKSSLEVRLHLGKWFNGETLDDNWFRRLLPAKGAQRRVPLPGLRLLPFRRTHDDKTKEAIYSLALRGDLLSLGFDLKGNAKKGLTFLKASKGPLAYFGLGSVETRIALLFTSERVAFGIGVKLKDLRLSFGPKEPDEEEPDEDDIYAGLKELFAEPEEKGPQTRLGAKKKDKFSLSVGYLSPLSEGSHGTLDIQLYDKKGNRGKTVWIPIDRRAGPLYLKQIGVGLKGVENVELSKGLSDKAQLSIALTGGLRSSIFEFGLIGAQVSIPLTNPRDLSFDLDGLDISLKVGAVIVSGSFLKNGFDYAGALTIELPKLTIGAMGFYGSMVVFSDTFDEEVIKGLRQRKVEPKLYHALVAKKITPASGKKLRPGFLRSELLLSATDGKTYTLVKDGDEVHVLYPEKTLFLYGSAVTATGGGIQVGPIEFTGIALGVGINKRLKVPPIEEVAGFPLVKMVMGEGGFQKDDISGKLINQLGKPDDDPVALLEEMGDALEAERGQIFICGGARFTIAKLVDCFALIVVQFGNDFELALLGLARFRQPSDPKTKPICYVEMQILMSLKPSEGSFKLQALLTSNSWVINRDCKLTGGFALYVWFAGKHKSDFVVTLGGYHPLFRRPDHYPQAPRLGLNWPVSPQLSIKGGAYFALTPSCVMLGARLEATFHHNRVSAWFTAHLDVIVSWSPLKFEAEIGVSLRVEASFALFTLKAALCVSIKMWGPPVGGIAHIELSILSLDIPFGEQRDPRPQTIESWALFCRAFLGASEADKRANRPVPLSDFIFTRPSLLSGRSNPDAPAPARRKQTEAPRPDAPWKVRADRLELAASAAVPVTALNVGRVKTNSPPEGVQQRELSGQSLLVKEPINLEAAGLQAQSSAKPLGVHPMGKSLQSILNVTVVRDDVAQTDAVDLTGWTLEAETGALPAALWNASKPKPDGPSEPTAELIPDCITGVKRLKPKAGKRGAQAEFSGMTWRPLEEKRVPESGAPQGVPTETCSRNIQAAAAGKQAEQQRIAAALAAVGFDLAWRPSQTEVRFRELQAEPLAGAVVATTA
jgi:hypothetical protein